MIKNKPVWRRRIAVLLAALLVLSVLPVTGAVYADASTETFEGGSKGGTFDYSDEAKTTSPGNLSVTKTVTGEGGDTTKAWGFTIKLEKPDWLKSASSHDSRWDGPFDYTISGGTTSTPSGKISFDAPETIYLTSGQTVTVSSVPPGTKYTVTETDADENGYKTTGEVYVNEGKGVETQEHKLTFTNTAHLGNLTIEKTLDGGGSAAEGTIYTFNIDGPDDVNGIYSEVEFTNGNATVQITGAGSKTIENLPQGDYKVTEQDANIDGYEWTKPDDQTAKVPDNGGSVEASFANKYTREKGNLTITKTVSGGPDGAATAAYTFNIDGPDDANGTYSDVEFKDGNATVTVTGGGSITIKDLPTGTYSITEQEAEKTGWTLSVTGGETVVLETSGKTAAIINTYTRDKGDLTITKTVTGGPADAAIATYTFNIDGPDDVNGTFSGVEFENGNAKVTVTGGESITIKDLPTGPYTVSEVGAEIEGYDWTATGNGTVEVEVKKGVDNPVNVTNDYTQKLGSLKITKTVESGGATVADKTYTFDVTGPEKYTVELKAGETKTLTDLVPGEYTITERDANIPGYSLEVTGDTTVTVEAEKTAEATITNTYTQKLGSLTIKKTVDANGAAVEGKEYSFTVTGPNDYSKKVNLKAGGSETLNNLVPGTYTVTEDKDGAEIENWSLEVTGDGEHAVEFEKNTEVEVINTYTRQKGNLTVTKTVDGEQGDKTKDWTFTVTLDDKTVTGTFGDMTFAEGVATFTLKHGESKTATGLPAGVGYTVTEAEANQDDYGTKSTGAMGTIPANDTAEAAFLNEKPAPEQPTMASLIITKAVVGGGDAAAGKTYTFIVTGPKGDKYTVTVTGTGSSEPLELEPGEYTITEENADIDGFTHTVDIPNNGEVTVTLEGDNEVTITNTYTPKPGDLTVTKTVTGDRGDQTKDWTFTVTLSDTTVSGVYGGMTFADGVATFTLKHGESRTATGLPAGTGYTVTEAEANADGYTTTAEGDTGTIPAGGTAEASFVNDKETPPPPPPTEPTTGSLTVSKAIVGGGTAAAEKTYTFTVTGPSWPEGRTLTVTGAGSVTLSNLTPGTYTVTEADAGISGYDWTVSGEGGVTVEAGRNSHITITNTYNDTEPDTGRLTVTKAIVGGGDAAAAKTYTFTVTGPDGYTNTVTVTGAGRVTLTDLVPGAYTVTEQDASIPGWTLEVTGGGEVTVEAGETVETTITNTYTETEKETGSLTVTKAVAGGGSAAAGKTYTFTVTGPDGYTNTVTVTGAGSATLTDLVPGTYTVTEQDASIPGWTLEVTGGGEVTVEAGKTAETTVTNTYTEIPYGGLTVRKIVDGEGGDKEMEFHFTVTLSDTSINGAYGGMTFTNGVATFTLKHGESVTAEGLPSGIGYTVTEAEANTDGYVSTSTGADGAIPHGGAALAEFRNSKGLPTPGTGRLVIRKAVTGSEGDKDKVFHFTVTLSDTSINGAYGDLTFVNGVAEFTLRSGENKWAKELPASTGYTVTETEADQDGYVTTITGATGTIPENSYGVWAEARFLNTKGPEPDEPDNPDNPDEPGEPGEPEEPFEELFDPDIPLSEMPDEPFDDAPGTGGSYQLGLWTALAALSLVGMLLAIVPLTSVNGRHVKRKGRGEKGR